MRPSDRKDSGGPNALNIVHAIHGLGLGGAQKVIASIVRGRRDPRLRYFVYSCNDGVHGREIEEAGATVRIVPRSLPKVDPFWVARLARRLRQDKIDLVHAHLFGDSLHGTLAARRAGRLPVVLSLHIGPKGWSGLQRLAYPRLLSGCRRAIACAESVQASVHQAYPHATRVMETIHNGIEESRVDIPTAERRAELRKDLGAGPKSILVATVGRLTEQKGQRDLIAAFARLRREQPDNPARLVLLGDGELRQALEAQAAAEGVLDHILFAGFRSNIPELLQVIDVVVFSSLFEGLPIALLEAMAAARPLVCTDIPGNLDAVRDDKEALIVRTADVSSLTQALCRITTDDTLRHRLGQGAKQRFLDQFTAASMVGRYENLYRQVLGVTEPGGN